MHEPKFDTEAAHKYFAAHCFNSAWKIMGQTPRSVEDNEKLIALGHASLWHWLQRPDRADQNIAVAYWMLSRIYSVVEQAEPARHYASLCAELTQRAELAAFFQGCAHEALARAAQLEGDRASYEKHLAEGRSIAEGLEDQEKKILSSDLDSIPKQ